MLCIRILSLDSLCLYAAHAHDCHNYVLVAHTHRYEQAFRNIEILYLTDANFTIVAGANANRTGQTYDPSGLLTLLKNNLDMKQIKVCNGFNCNYSCGCARHKG
jgi:hypothetical protein